MKYDARQLLEIIIDEAAQVLGLGPDAVEQCRRKLAELFQPRWPVLFLASGEQPPSDQTVEAFRALTAMGVEPSLVLSQSFSRVWSPQQLEARLGAVRRLDRFEDDDIAALPDRYPLLCILTLSDNAVAKTALGLRDAVPPRVIRAFLDRGKPVVVAGLPPQQLAVEESDAIFWNLPLALRQWVYRGYSTLDQWGAEFVEPAQLPRAVRRHLFDLPESAGPGTGRKTITHAQARAFITVADVRAARNRHERRIDIPPNAVVTDEAHEAARRWGILLVE
jgi:hypothetical protein